MYMNIKEKKKKIGFITIILFLALISVVVVWKERNKPLTEEQANEIVKEMNGKLVEMDNNLWIFGLPTIKMGRTYELMGCKTYQKTDDANIKTIAQVKEDTEKLLTPEAAEYLFYRLYMNLETLCYVESDGLLYKHVNLSGFLCTGIYQDSEIVELVS